MKKRHAKQIRAGIHLGRYLYNSGTTIDVVAMVTLPMPFLTELAAQTTYANMRANNLIPTFGK